MHFQRYMTFSRDIDNYCGLFGNGFICFSANVFQIEELLIGYLFIVSIKDTRAKCLCELFFQNQTFLNINISSYQYQYPDAIFLRVSNVAVLYSLYLVSCVVYCNRVVKGGLNHESRAYFSSNHESRMYFKAFHKLRIFIRFNRK